MRHATTGPEVLARLHQAFPIAPVQYYLGTETSEKSDCLIGIEIEIPWRAYFPSLWEKHFGEGRRFRDFTAEQVRRLDGDLVLAEPALIKQLKKTVACGVRRGRDRYWEFALSPADQVGILVDQVAILSANSLCPLGPYSLHATIGKLRPTPRAYLALLFLELVHGTSLRISSGMNREDPSIARGWSRKGRAGICHKKPYELTSGEKTALEFRTLQLPDSLTQLFQLLQQIARLANWLYQEQRGNQVQEWNRLVEFLQELLFENSLAGRNWENPDIEPGLWERYLSLFPSMSQAAKKMWP
jgi:hypothetical protein